MASALDIALELRDILEATRKRIVLAESCTAGRIAATLGAIPGISQWLCGDFVVYRNASKVGWLGIPSYLLDDPETGPVSAEVTRLLAAEALRRTPEAELALSITGEIGPVVSPNENDGLVFCATQLRSTNSASCNKHRLACPTPSGSHDFQARLLRLEEATQLALRAAVAALATI